MIDDDVKSLIKQGKVLEARELQRTKPVDDNFMSSPAVRARFEHQNDFGPHAAFDNCGTNWKQYFFSHDGLTNVTDDVVFSIFDKYMCKVGCQVCYLNDYWMGDNRFGYYVPETLCPEWEKHLLECFTYFTRPNCIDDIVMLKNHYPHLYEFYVRHSHLLEHNITDNGFFSQYPLLMNELHFKEIAYLSFSDHVLEKNDGKIVDKIIPMLAKLNARSPVHKVNFINSLGYPSENPNVMRLFKWVVENTTADTYFHTDLCQDVDWVADMKVFYDYDLPSIYYQENEHNPPIICQILTETIQLRYNKFYSTLTGSTVEQGNPFYEFDGPFDPHSFLAGVLKGKLRSYRLYRDRIVHRDNNRYYDYFDWCVENVVVNDDYTFIPISMINPMSPMYQKLMKSGDWVDSNFGLLKQGATAVKPLAEVK